MAGGRGRDRWDRLGLWAEINRAFSPFNIGATKAAYLEYRRTAARPHFVGFVLALGIFPREELDAVWQDGVELFPPGVFDVVDGIVERNLTGAYTQWTGEGDAIIPGIPQGEAPLPMTFERRFHPLGDPGAGGRDASVTVRWTPNGIKVVLWSEQVPFDESEAGNEASRWSARYQALATTATAGSARGTGKKKAAKTTARRVAKKGAKKRAKKRARRGGKKTAR